MFGRDEYQAIKRTLNFERNYLYTFAVIVLDWVLVAVSLELLRHGGTSQFFTSQVLLAVIFFHNFCILHECGHGNVSSSRFVNVATGLYASVLCFMPFFPWKYIHQEHHFWAGNPERDPTGRNLKRWRKQGRVPWVLRFAWRSWVPLGALAQHLVFWSYPVSLLRSDRSKMWSTVVSVVVPFAAYLTAYVLYPTLFRPSNFTLAFVIYLFAEELVNFPHHSDLFRFTGRLQLWEQWKAARSCYYPMLVSELLVLNFNFHIEHHLYPSLPWYRLRGARRVLRAALGPDYNESVGIGWNLANRSQGIQEIFLGEMKG